MLLLPDVVPVNKCEMKTEILKHDIKWWVRSKAYEKKGLDETTVEHIEYMIEQGYTSGEIAGSWTDSRHRYYETSGWWKIVNWEDIACQLRSALLNCTADTKRAGDEKYKALQRFDDNWI